MAKETYVKAKKIAAITNATSVQNCAYTSALTILVTHVVFHLALFVEILAGVIVILFANRTKWNITSEIFPRINANGL